MANTGMVMGKWISGGSEDQPKRIALDSFHQDVIGSFSSALATAGFNPRVVSICGPHDALLCVTSRHVIDVTARGSATDAVSTHYYGDYSSRPEVDGSVLAREAVVQLNWVNTLALSFDRSLLEDATRRKVDLDRVAREQVQSLLKKRELADALGISEAFKFIETARRHFETGTETGYSDCKSNCRRAIESLLRGLSGEADVRTAVRSLGKQGIFGMTEGDVVEALAAVAAKLAGLASKQGAHAPMAGEEDARFTLRLTEALFDYLVAVGGKSKGF